MKRYVVRYQGNGTPPGPDLQHLHNMPGLKVVDAAAPHMVLVEATDAAAHQLKEMLSWTVTPEAFVRGPDTRKQIRQPS
jgi:hypothetical protein